MPALALPFFKLYPGGNPTILVRDNSLFPESPEAAAYRSAIAQALMAPDHLGAEQVGFLDTSRALPHMEMMGGEFCVNATLCAAFVFARMGLLPALQEQPGTHAGTMTVSGAADPVRVRVISQPSESTGEVSRDPFRQAAVALPLPAFPAGGGVTECAPGEVLVRLPGITHLLLDTETHPLPPSPLAAAAVKRAEYGLDAEEAAGVIWHSPCFSTETARAILPVVHVAATGSAVAETACGSGSLALALLLAQDGGTSFTIRQPSGHDISITLERPSSDTAPLLAWISGTVYLTAEGMTTVYGV